MRPGPDRLGLRWATATTCRRLRDGPHTPSALPAPKQDIGLRLRGADRPSAGNLYAILRRLMDADLIARATSSTPAIRYRNVTVAVTGK